MTLFTELKRRNVFRVGAAYLVASWLLIEASSVLLEAFGAPGWVPKAVAALLVVGFPIALSFAWAFEVTPDGVKRESEVDRTSSITHHTGHRLDLMTMAMLVLVVLLVGVERFVLTPAAVPAPAPSEAPPVAVVTPDEVSIAVLPFQNMSADADNEYFADGISEEILNLLADVRDLSVASRTSAFAFKGTNASVPDIATALGVRYVLEGSVRKSGSQVRITAQLIDASNDRHLWSQTYDRTLDDIFRIQDEIAGAIGEALQVQLLGDSGQRVAAESIDPDVYAEFLEARYQLRRRSNEDIIAALEKLKDVAAREPGFARGHAVLAEAYLLAVLQRTGVLEREQGFALAREQAEIARAMDDRLALIYQVLGLLAGAADKDMARSSAYYEQAIALEPNESGPHHWLGINRAVAGFPEQALMHYMRALELAPDNANIAGNIASTLLVLGRADEAMVMAERQMAFGNPVGGLTTKAQIDLTQGDFGAAETDFARYRELVGRPDLAPLHTALVAAARDPNAVPQLLQILTELGPTSDGRVSRLNDLLAVAVHAPALYEEILLLLSDESFAGGVIDAIWLPHFAELRTDARFIGWVERAGIDKLWRLSGLPADCRADGDTYRCGFEGFER